MKIREAVPEDMTGVCALNDVVQRLHADHRPDLYRWPPDPAGRRAILDKALLEDGWRLWVAEVEGGLAGYIATELIVKPETALRLAHKEGHIHHISVDLALRRIGIGRALALRAIAGLEEQGADRITVGYWAFNKASCGLFASLGFETASVLAELRPAA